MMQHATSSIATLNEFRSRGLETAFLVERYHRAFDDELALVRLLVDRLCSADKLALGPRALRAALDELDERLTAHEHVQEHDLFPAYERSDACAPALFDLWISDCSSLFAAAEAVRAACVRARVGQSAASCVAAIDRVQHLVDEIQEHLVAEVKLLAPWAGVEPPPFASARS
jgi:hypothetical protein